MRLENLNAGEYLEARDRAARNAGDKPAFQHIQKELRTVPRTRERLVFELLELAWAALGSGVSPNRAALPALEMWDAVTDGMVANYRSQIELMAIRCFELMEHCKDSRYSLTLVSLLCTIRMLDSARFSVVYQELSRTATEDPNDARRFVLEAVGLSRDEDEASWAKMRRSIKSELNRNIQLMVKGPSASN